jgi:curli production protein
MMTADVNLQAWIETAPDTSPAMVTPFVRSPADGMLHYQIKVVKRGPAGSSSIGQSGDVAVHADQPTALSRFSLSVGAHDECTIELILVTGSRTSHTYHFDCPR